MTKTSKESRPNVAAIVATLLFLGVVTYLSIVMNIYERLQRDFDDELIKSEFLLSEKLVEQKKNYQLERDLAERELEHSREQVRLEFLIGQLQQGEQTLSQQKSALSILLKRQRNENQVLTQKIINDSIKTIESSQAMTREKASDILIPANESQLQDRVIVSHETPIVTDVLGAFLKKNSRLTTKTARAKSIRVAFTVSTKEDDVEFKILDPAGKLLLLNEEKLFVRCLPLDERPGLRIEMTYSPLKFQSGKYRVLAYGNEADLLVSIEVALE
jgi:hypothetical protein